MVSRPSLFAPWLAVGVLYLGIAACSADSGAVAGDEDGNKARAIRNPVVHFEIPVTDMDRAVAFYEAVLGYRLTRQQVDGYDMAFFPRADGAAGASGALARGDVYRPSKEGVIVYFDVPDIDAVLQKAKARGARILYAKKDIGAAGFVAEIEDSEGNRIALSQVRD